jgi:tetratricopeptide (TPR) repeat protein
VLSQLRARKDPYYRTLSYGALFSLSILCIHNLADFNTHVPSNAVTLIAIAALCLVLVNSHRTQLGERFLMEVKTIPLANWKAIAVISTVLSLALLLGRQSWCYFQSQRLTARWSLNKQFLVTGDPDDSQFSLLSEATRWMPWNDGAHYFEAMTYESAALSRNFFQFFDKQRFLERAERDILDAVRLRPTEARYWAALGRIEQGLSRAESAESAFQQAIKLAKSNGMIQRDYGFFLLSEGKVQGAAERLVLAREQSPYLDLRPMLEGISSRTSDQQVWRRMVRYNPQDLRVYADFLKSRGQTNLSGQIIREAEALEKPRK